MSVEAEEENERKSSPDLILIFSGKRKSGKDFVCDKLYKHFKMSAEYSLSKITLSAPLKEIYAKEHGLNFEEMLGSGEYKEKFRLDMINWSDLKRNEDAYFFCKKSVDNISNGLKLSETNIWIVTDARRLTDLRFFYENFENLVKTVRVVADERTRIERNWRFVNGVDNAASECDLDSFNNWDFIIRNNNDSEMEEDFLQLVNFIVNLNNLKKAK